MATTDKFWGERRKTKEIVIAELVRMGVQLVETAWEMTLYVKKQYKQTIQQSKLDRPRQPFRKVLEPHHLLQQQEIPDRYNFVKAFLDKDSGINYHITWTQKGQAPSNSSATSWKLYLPENSIILNNSDDKDSWNKRGELMSKCRHRSKYLLSAVTWCCLKSSFFFKSRSERPF